MCPISPAAPRAPRSSCPPVTMPTPMPVEAFTKTRSRWRSRWPRRSDSAITLASLSTNTGARRQLAQERRQLDAVPARHDRRVQAGAALEVDGAGDAQPDGAYVLRRPAEPSSRSANPATTCGIRSSADGADLLVEVDGRQHPSVEVADAELGAAAPDRAGEHDAGVAG